jgi:hypothetical protein
MNTLWHFGIKKISQFGFLDVIPDPQATGSPFVGFPQLLVEHIN